MNTKDVYLAALHLEAVGARLNRGTQSQFHPWEDSGWIVKVDAPGAPPQIAWEVEVYCLLEELGGSHLAPAFDAEASNVDQLVVQLINAAASLEDYAVLFATQSYPVAVLQDLMGAVGRTLAEFHQLGFVHGDFHCGNVVVALEKGNFRPYLIDFGITQHEELGPYPHDLSVEPSEDADLDRMDESLRSISTDPSFIKGLEELASEHYRY